jgi:ATP-binding cassette subfamily F protein 3
MQEAEKRVEKLTADLAKLDATLGDPALYADAQKAQKITLERGLIAKALIAAEEKWLIATAAFEEAEKTQDDAVA